MKASERAFTSCWGAISDGDCALLSKLLSADPQLVHMRDPEQRTLLLNACFPILECASLPVVEVLIAAGSDVKATDYARMNCAHGIAVMHSEEFPQPADIIRVLVGRGMDVDGRDVYGNTPLWRAIFDWSAGVSTAVIDVLLELGADMNCENDSGISPRELVVDSPSKNGLRKLLE